MSTETVDPDRSVTERPESPSPLARARATLARGVAAVSFWLAVTLPAVYLPLLVAGAGASDRAVLLGALLLANAVALLVGHTHRRD